MAGWLLLLWLLSVVVLWVCAIRGLREVSAEVDATRRANLSLAILLAAAPPTVVFLVSAFVLLQAAPTVQFNVGNAWAMDLWSFWAHWWPAILGCSGLQTVCYLLWFIASVVTRTRASVQSVLGLGCLSSIWGSLLLSMAGPTV